MDGITLPEEELRLALVMSGGVSLAVWIGGVTREIAAFIGDVQKGPGAEATTAARLRSLLGTKVRTDVICGTSAGGINAAYLGLAVACRGSSAGAQLDKLREVWIRDGSVDALLRPALTDKAPSLLRGDDVLLRCVRDALNPVFQAKDKQDLVDVIITTTLLEGTVRQLPDAFGAALVDLDHRGLFRFTSEEPKNDFARPDVVEKLAVAARSTSSFPGAFEPHFVRIDGTDTPTDMTGIADFETSRFVVDGGVLDNSPIDVALARIFAKRADGPTRRVLALVAPDAGAMPTKPPQPDPNVIPGGLETVIASAVAIPRNQSLSSQIRALEAHNTRVRQSRADRILLMRNTSHEALDRMADALFQTYQRQRIQDAVEYIAREVGVGIAMDGSPDPDRPASGPPFAGGIGSRNRDHWLAQTLAQFEGELCFVPQHAPTDPEGSPERQSPGWRWGTLPVEHMSRLYLDLVRRTQRIAIRSETSKTLAQRWEKAFECIEASDDLREMDEGYWRKAAPGLTKALGNPDPKRAAAEAAHWAETTLRNWRTQPLEGIRHVGEKKSAFAAAGMVAQWIAIEVLNLQKDFETIDAAIVRNDDPRVDEERLNLRAFLTFFVRPDEGTSQVLERLLSFEVIHDALGAASARIEQEIDYVQISCDTPMRFGGGTAIADRLNGLQLFAFGSFYKGSWRANDWMWGRLDGARRMTAVMLDPARVSVVARRLGTRSRADSFADSILDIALGSPGSASHALLASMVDRAAITRELAYLDDPKAIVPGRLAACLDALVLRQHLDILCEELPRVAQELTNEEGTSGTRLSGDARRFRDLCKQRASTGRLEANDVPDVMASYAVGSERLTDEVGTDRLPALASQLLCVSLAVMRGETGWYATFGKALAALRLPLLALHLFMRNIANRSGIGIAANALLLGVGATALALAPLGVTLKAPVFVVGVATLTAGVIWLALRIPSLIAAVCLILGSIVAALAYGFVMKVINLHVDHGKLEIGPWWPKQEVWRVTLSDDPVRIVVGATCAGLALLFFWLGDLSIVVGRAKSRVRNTTMHGRNKMIQIRKMFAQSKGGDFVRRLRARLKPGEPTKASAR